MCFSLVFLQNFAIGAIILIAIWIILQRFMPRWFGEGNEMFWVVKIIAAALFCIGLLILLFKAIACMMW